MVCHSGRSPCENCIIEDGELTDINTGRTRADMLGDVDLVKEIFDNNNPEFTWILD